MLQSPLLRSIPKSFCCYATYLKNIKRSSWRELCSQFNRNIPISRIWKLAKIFKNIDVPTLPQASTEQLDAFLCKIAPQYVPEKRELPFDVSIPKSSDSTHFLSSSILLDEVKSFVRRKRNTAPGPNGINYKILKNLPEISLSTLTY